MATKVEGKHAGEFIMREQPIQYGREAAVVASGQNLVDGQLVQLSGGKLIAKATTLNSAQTAFTVPIEGIIIGNWNQSASGPDGAVDSADPAPYLKRGPAILRDESVTFPVGATQKSVALTALAAMGIITRNDG